MSSACPRPWTLGPFAKHDAVNPVLSPSPDSVFRCPVRGELVHWEAKDVFNPAAVVRGGKVYLLYRAEDRVGRYAGTSRIGLAVSDDGLHFTRHPEPVLYPDHDDCLPHENEGGCEDPRVVEDEGGTYYMYYTAYNGEKARLFVATSTDLVSWRKHGSVFAQVPACEALYTKSGAVVCLLREDRLVATRLNGKYWMYFGEGTMYLAYSDDLIRWTPVTAFAEGDQVHNQPGVRGSEFMLPILRPRQGRFDNALVEPGPPALLTDHGIVLLYNSAHHALDADDPVADRTYAPLQALFDASDPSALLARELSPFMLPEKPYEMVGQVKPTCFVEGLARLGERWLLYYGTADSHIAVASC